MDPRNQKRPDGDAGSNWARCRRCGRAAHHVRLIRHAKSCPDGRTDTFDRAFLSKLDRENLRRALWLLRRQRARPNEISPAAAQYDGLATEGSVKAEYRRRGWKVPKPTRDERP